MENKQYIHYFKDVAHLNFIDIYRILELYDVDHPCLQHAAKKILCAGHRGSKNYVRDVTEARDTLNRFLEMVGEDYNKDIEL